VASKLDRPLGEGSSSRRRAPLRGALMKIAAALGIVVALGFLISRVDLHHDLSRMRLSMVSGEAQGNYHVIVARLAAIASERRGAVREVPTAGSIENVSRLVAAAKTCDVQFGLAQDGTDWTAGQGGQTPLRLYGRLAKPEAVLFLGKDADRLREMAELRGMKIGVGPAGSGTEKLARQIFALQDLATLGVVLETHPFEEQLALLSSGELTLGVFVMEDDAPLVVSAIRDRGLSISAFSHVAGLAKRLPHLHPGHIEAGRYDAVRLFPSTDREVMRVETLVVGNGCAGRTQTMDMLSVLAKEFPDFVRHNKDTENTSTLPMADVAQEFFENGGPQMADLYVPWLVDVMPPANWAYVVMGVSLLFNAMGFGHRFRLWRIDAARVRLEEQIVGIFGRTVTLGDIQHTSPDADAKYAADDVRGRVKKLIADFEDLAAKSRRYSLSMLVPMGQEMAYRYQEGVIYETLAVLRDFLKRATAAGTKAA
jgi:hypothetical protein